MKKDRISRCKFDTELVKKAIEFALSPKSVQTLSWGCKVIVFDGQKHRIPALCRRRNIKRMHESYLLQAEGREGGKKKVIGKTLFRKIAAEGTGGETQARRAVDYVTGFLIDDSIEALRKIVSSFSVFSGASESERERILKELEVAKAFLKHGYNDHLNNISDCISHSITQGLSSTVSELSIRRPRQRAGCSYPFQVCSKTKRLCGALPNALEVAADCEEKSVLFMGHRIRVTNQKLHITRLIDGMKERCRRGRKSSEALVVLDYKMKFDAAYYREKAVDYYGKRGISWRGSMVMLFAFNEKAKGPVLQRIYFDDASFEDNKQDSLAVMSLIEHLLSGIRTSLPHIKHVSLQSENAKCYMSRLL